MTGEPDEADEASGSVADDGTAADEGADDAVSVAIEAGDGSATLELPRELVEMLAGPGDSAADVAMLSCAQRVHAAVHDSEGDAADDLRTLESRTLALFGARFGSSFADVTGLTGEADDH